jgi:hypothetical protein
MGTKLSRDLQLSQKRERRGQLVIFLIGNLLAIANFVLDRRVRSRIQSEEKI